MVMQWNRGKLLSEAYLPLTLRMLICVIIIMFSEPNAIFRGMYSEIQSLGEGSSPKEEANVFKDRQRFTQVYYSH